MMTIKGDDDINFWKLCLTVKISFINPFCDNQFLNKIQR